VQSIRTSQFAILKVTALAKRGANRVQIWRLKTNRGRLIARARKVRT
jgi:hypothetical protein